MPQLCIYRVAEKYRFSLEGLGLFRVICKKPTTVTILSCTICCSLRTLCRALVVSANNSCGNILRSLHTGLCLSFLVQLDNKSHTQVLNMINKSVLLLTLRLSIVICRYRRFSLSSFLAYNGKLDR